VPVSQTFPDNERLDYTYDASGAQQSIKTTPSGVGQQTIVSSIFRNSRGQTIAAVYGNSAISIYKYNEASNLRLNQIQTAVGGTLTITGGVPQITGGTTLQNYGYSFDNNGNVIGVTDAVTPSLNATYGYDSLDQLISMTPVGPALPYSYDKLGNLTNKENVAQTYGGSQACASCPPNRGPHALATASGVTYNYDFNGNLISTSNGTNITWNSENMPTKVVQGGATMYQKSFLGESLWKKVEPGLTTYYLPSMRIEGTQVRKFFGGFAERSPDGSLKFYHGDHLGSASLVTDFVNNVAHVVRRQAYMPYGEDRPGSVSGTFTPKYQFNFKEKEESTGFYDYGARLYNPATGRWLSADTSSTDGLNRYAYVSNSPINYVDPTGNFQELPRIVPKEGGDSWVVNVGSPELPAAAAAEQRNKNVAGRARRRDMDLVFLINGVRNPWVTATNLNAAANLYGTQPKFVAGIPNASGGDSASLLGQGGLNPGPRPSAVTASTNSLTFIVNNAGIAPGKIKIVTFSNGVQTLLSTLRATDFRNFGAVTIVAPHTGSVNEVKEVVSKVGSNTPVYLVSSYSDEFVKSGVVIGPGILKEAFRGYTNVTVLDVTPYMGFGFSHTFDNYVKAINAMGNR
jgi:RHS repeat-associated protein